MTVNQRWNPNLYDDKHHFVADFGEEVLALLAPQAGERILDLGCGTGHLTQKIAAHGAAVVGIDSSLEMIEQARANYPDLQFLVADGENFQFDQPFDAVFSNAALHWMKNAPAVVACIGQALQPGGRFVAEFGGQKNITRVWSALNAAMIAHGHPAPVSPWYFPSIGEYTSLLEQHGFFVTYAFNFKRPTPLSGPDGLRNWLAMFANSMLNRIPEGTHAALLADIEDRLRPALYADDVWSVDYVRLRVIAYKESV